MHLPNGPNDRVVSRSRYNAGRSMVEGGKPCPRSRCCAVISQSHVDLVLRGHWAFGDTGEAYWHAEDGRQFVGVEEATNTTFEQHAPCLRLD